MSDGGALRSLLFGDNDPGYNLASIFAGALSPLIATGLMTAYRPETWPISVYMIILALITLVSVYYATETRVAAAKT